MDELLEEYKSEFDYQIIKRGEDYYNNGHVVRCFSTNEGFIAVVRGCNRDYTVRVYNESDYLYMECECPYEDHCKHEYAVLLSIRDKAFNIVNLKKEIPEVIYNLKEIVSKIPADKLKEYILNKGADYVVFETTTFEKEFFDYLPRQSKNYYYNSLYNEYILKMNFVDLLTKYERSIKKYIEKESYEDAFDIIQSIIDVYIDLNINDDDIPNIYPSLGMYLRIIYRKCDSKLKKKITQWILKFEKEKYYNNIFLEDIIVLIK